MNEFIDEDLYEYLLKHSSEEPEHLKKLNKETHLKILNPSCLLYTSPSPRDKRQSRMPSSA